MSKSTLSDKQLDFNKKISEINKESQVSCCLWGNEENDSCDGGIISAHSIQRGKILESISELGKVSYLSNSTNEDLSEIKPTFKLEGIKKFSTFHGFCGKHDKEIFQPIEDKAFEGTEDQCNRYAYRAIAKELHAQMVSLKKNKLLLGDDINGECPANFLLSYPAIQAGKMIVPNFIRDLMEEEIKKEILRKQVKGIEFNIQELSMLENHLKSVIKNQCNSLIKHKLYIFNYNVPIACSGVFIQYLAPNGKTLIEENETINVGKIHDCKQTILNVFPENGKTYVLFSTIKNNKKIIDFLDKLFKQENIDDIKLSLSHIVLNHIENIAFNPSYINSISIEEKEKILQLYFHNIIDVLSYNNSNVSIFIDTKMTDET